MNEDVASTSRLLDEALARYVRPDTFPLAIRMLKPGEAIPEGVKVPSKTMGQQWIVCQSVGVARRYGWGIAVGKDDVICPLAAIAFGFRKPNEEYLRGFVSVGMYCKDEQAAAKLEASTWRFQPGTYDYVCVAPLSRATFEPDVVAVYANSAQVMRLVHASLYKRGGRVVRPPVGAWIAPRLSSRPWPQTSPRLFFRAMAIACSAWPRIMRSLSHFRGPMRTRSSKDWKVPTRGALVTPLPWPCAIR